MYGYTKSTPLDRTYRYSDKLEITQRDEGAAIYKWADNKRPQYVGVIVNQKLIKAGE